MDTRKLYNIIEGGWVSVSYHYPPPHLKVLTATWVEHGNISSSGTLVGEGWSISSVQSVRKSYKEVVSRH